MQSHRVVRSLCAFSLTLGIFVFQLGPPPAMAQIRAVQPGFLGPRGHDWGVKSEDLSGVDMDRIETVYRQGLAFLQEGECKRAEQKFRFVLSFLEDHAETLFLAGTAARCQGDYEAAKVLYRKAIESDPEMYLAYKNLAVSHLALRESDAAIQQLARLQTLRLECRGDCALELEDAYSDLRTIFGRLTRRDVEILIAEARATEESVLLDPSGLPGANDLEP